jgi:hypothetical protein
MQLDRMSYLIFEADRVGNIWIAERKWSDMDRRTTLDDVASLQFENLVSVIEFNSIEGTSRDVTEDMAKDVADIWAREGEPLTELQREYLEFHLGVSFANQFAQAAE